MESGQKPRKRDRLNFLFKRKERTQQTTSSQTSSIQRDDMQPPADTAANTGDGERSKARYLDAARLLEETVKAYQDKWGSFNFPELKGEPKDFDDSLFREKINAVVETRKNNIKDPSAWEKCKDVVQCAFTAFSPFAKNFLTIAKEGQAVFATHIPFSYQ